MIDFGTPDLVIDEKMNIKVFEKIYAYIKGNDDEHIPLSYTFNVNLKRFGAEDVYSIYGEYDGNTIFRGWDHQFYGHSLVNIINNKIKLQKHFIFGERDYNVLTHKLMFHHSEVAQKFRTMKYLFSYLKASDAYEGKGNRRFMDNKSLFTKIISYASLLDFKDIFKTYKVEANHLVNMRFVKNIFINNNATHFIGSFKWAKASTFHPKHIVITNLRKAKAITPTIGYSNFFIKFKQLDTLKHNFEIATIYWKPYDKTDVFSSDFKFQDNSYMQIGTKKFKLAFQEAKNLDQVKKKITKGGIIEVGKLLFPEYTSYDFTKKKIITTGDEFAARGFLLPFNFKGDFFYKMHIGINAVFKKIDFFVHQKVNQKILDPYEGKIKLVITSNHFPFDKQATSKTFIIDSSLFKKIIDLGEFINPLAIVRLSNEEDEDIS